ncbi:MAG: hypothetical protein RI967_652 [Planctomycetota bacterium]
MTPEQFQQIHSMLSELVENRRESLALQREALKGQQQSIEAQNDAVAFSKTCQLRAQRQLKAIIVIVILALGGLILVPLLSAIFAR